MSKYEAQRKKFTLFRRNPNMANTLSNNNVMSLYEDRRGGLWIGTRGAGLDRLDRRSNRFTNFRNIPGNPGSLPHNTIRAIYEDRHGILWLGTYGGGLSRFDPERNSFTNFRENPDDPESLSHNQIRSIIEDRRGLYWIGTDGGGLSLFDPQTGKFRRYQNDPGNRRSLSSNRVMKVLEDSVGRIWICTFGGGLNLYDPARDSFTFYKNDPDDQQSLALDYVVTIFEDSRHRFWLGTDGAGIEQFDPEKGIFHHCDKNQDLPNKTVYVFLEDSRGDLWFTHNLGVSRLNPNSGALKNYSVQDGLQGNEFVGNSGFKNPSTGEMFFGGLNGFNAFFPDRITENPVVPPVLVTRLQLFNKTITPNTVLDGRRILTRSIQDTKEITLSHRDRVIAFEFAALNFISSEKNQYAYKMEGFDGDWIAAGKRRFASYTALPAGRYRFRVKASNNDGVWNETGTSIAIRIVPPFWKTWWFMTLSALLGILGFVGIYQYRVRSLTRAKIKLEQLVDLRTRELKEVSLLDPLTGLRNRRYLSEIMKDDTAAFLKTKEFLLHNPNKRVYGDFMVYGVMMIDIDHFKSINDQYGHDMGDRWLAQLAAILKRSIRADDEVIRFGGEEFLVILKNTNADYMENIALKIKAEAAKISLAAANKELKRSCSIGYTQFPFYVKAPGKITFEKAILLADLGLYYAKENGRNMAVRILPQEKIPSEEQILQLTTSLQYGIENDFYKIKPAI